MSVKESVKKEVNKIDEIVGKLSSPGFVNKNDLDSSGKLASNVIISVDENVEEPKLNQVPISAGQRNVLVWLVKVNKKQKEELVNRLKKKGINVTPDNFRTLDEVKQVIKQNLKTQTPKKVKQQQEGLINGKNTEKFRKEIATNKVFLKEKQGISVGHNIPTETRERKKWDTQLTGEVGISRREYNIKHSIVKGIPINTISLDTIYNKEVYDERKAKSKLNYALSFGYSILAADYNINGKRLSLSLDPFMGFLRLGWESEEGRFLEMNAGLVNARWTKKGVVFSSLKSNLMFAAGLSILSVFWKHYSKIVGNEIKESQKRHGKVLGFIWGVLKGSFKWVTAVFKETYKQIKKRGLLGGIGWFASYWFGIGKELVKTFIMQNFVQPIRNFKNMLAFFKRLIFKRKDIIHNWKEALAKNDKKFSLYETEKLYHNAIIASLQGDKYRALSNTEQALHYNVPAYLKGRLYAYYEWEKVHAAFVPSLAKPEKEEKEMRERLNELTEKVKNNGWSNLSKEEKDELMFIYSYFVTKLSFVERDESFNKNKKYYSNLIFFTLKDSKAFQTLLSNIAYISNNIMYDYYGSLEDKFDIRSEFTRYFLARDIKDLNRLELQKNLFKTNRIKRVIDLANVDEDYLYTKLLLYYLQEPVSKSEKAGIVRGIISQLKLLEKGELNSIMDDKGMNECLHIIKSNDELRNQVLESIIPTKGNSNQLSMLLNLPIKDKEFEKTSYNSFYPEIIILHWLATNGVKFNDKQKEIIKKLGSNLQKFNEEDIKKIGKELVEAVEKQEA